jgi:hypothetical protein
MREAVPAAGRGTEVVLCPVVLLLDLVLPQTRTDSHPHGVEHGQQFLPRVWELDRAFRIVPKQAELFLFDQHVIVQLSFAFAFSFAFALRVAARSVTRSREALSAVIVAVAVGLIAEHDTGQGQPADQVTSCREELILLVEVGVAR